MPVNGPEAVIPPPPLAAPPTGLIQAAQVVEHVVLQTEGNLSKLVGPDAPDTILASALIAAARELFGPRVVVDPTDRELIAKEIDALTLDQRDQIRDRAAEILVAAPTGGMELGARSADPLDHWMAGIRWQPEPHLNLELVDPCTDAGTSKIVYGASGATGISRKAPVTGQPFVVVLHDSCSTFGWKDADYVGRAQRGLAPRETIAVEREFMHGTLMGASRVVTDGATTNASATVTSATAGFSQADLHKRITGAGIPANSFIGVVTNATTIGLSSSATANTPVNATATAAGVTLTIAGLAGGANRYLSDRNCKVYNTGAVDPTPVQALAYANEVIAKWGGGQGMIHVTPFFAEIAAAAGSPFKTDARGRLVTLNGNIVVPGNGYDGIGPDGTGGPADDAGNDSGHNHEWIYVSDLPVIWREPSPEVFPYTLREATNRDLNEVTFRAERPYAIAWSALLQTAIKCKLF